MKSSAAKKKDINVFIPLMKVDEEQRLLYGHITAEELDQSGEMMDYVTSKPNFEEWSGRIEEASGGLSKGNLRIMHGLKVGGKLTDLAFNDDAQTVEVCAKVTDDAEWNNVLEGCYTGFSVGGSYAKKWKEVVDGQTITKYTARPNEVSLVDNPCVKSATFQLIKADGSVEDHTWSTATENVMEPTNEEVVEKATSIALAKADGSTWMDHIHDAREELVKAASKGKKNAKTTDKGKDADDEGEENAKNAGADPETGENDGTDEDGDSAEADTSKPAKKKAKKSADKSDKAAGADNAIADRLKQKWVTSDGQSFSKKADAAAHEDELVKASTMTDIDRLRERLAKATETPTVVEVPLNKSFQRMGDLYNALITPFESGAPKLEKGMYTVSQFARALWDIGNIALAIKKEGNKEGNDPEDNTAWTDIGSSIEALSETLGEYLDDQIKELLAGINDDEMACVYDYYYCAAKDDSENALAKDVCSAIETHKDASRERRAELLQKAFYVAPEVIEAPVVDDTLQKRFEAVEAENGELKKVATEAISKVEELSKRVQAIEDTPQPRPPAPGHVLGRPGDEQMQFFGKSFASEGDLRSHLHNMIATQGADAVALEMIKASQSGGGQKMIPHR